MNMYDYFHLTVASICEKDGKFLVVEEVSKKTGKTVFNQPAGHVELNEPIIDAVVRETLEETSWSIKPTSIVGIYQNIVDVQGQSRHYCRVCFTCDVIEKTTLDIDPDITAAHWLTADEILNLPNPRSSMVKKCLEDYLAGKRFSLDILTTLR